MTETRAEEDGMPRTGLAQLRTVALTEIMSAWNQSRFDANTVQRLAIQTYAYWRAGRDQGPWETALIAAAVDNVAEFFGRLEVSSTASFAKGVFPGLFVEALIIDSGVNLTNPVGYDSTWARFGARPDRHDLNRVDFRRLPAPGGLTFDRSPTDSADGRLDQLEIARARLDQAVSTTARLADAEIAKVADAVTWLEGHPQVSGTGALLADISAARGVAFGNAAYAYAGVWPTPTARQDAARLVTGIVDETGGWGRGHFMSSAAIDALYEVAQDGGKSIG